jgi:hypothetical protein
MHCYTGYVIRLFAICGRTTKCTTFWLPSFDSELKTEPEYQVWSNPCSSFYNPLSWTLTKIADLDYIEKAFATAKALKEGIQAEKQKKTGIRLS